MTQIKVLAFRLMLVAVLMSRLPVAAQSTNTLTLNSVQKSTNGWSLSWEAGVSSNAYSVQYQDTLKDGIWRLPASAPPYPVSTNAWTDPSMTNLSRFYRVLGVPPALRGSILASNFVSLATTQLLTLVFNAAGAGVTPKYNVRLYKLVYETIDPLGARTVASGALLLPEGLAQPLPLVSYQHGTDTQTNVAPSSMNFLSSEIGVAAAFATSGYAAVAPDYLGLGVSPGLHPYCHARSEATASIDMIRAATSFCAGNGFVLTNRLFLCGYSQGGHATMALLRELETYYTNEFAVTACAPMAGPYDMSGVTTSNFLSGAAQSNPYYFLYLLGAYQAVYHFAPSLASILASPYDTTLPPMLNGNTAGSQINAAMPSDPAQILKPEFRAAFQTDPRHPLRLALQDNDTYDWKPRSPLRLYHCAADQDVIIANSQVALATFQSLGATQAQLIDLLPNTNHAGCSLPSLMDAKGWFDSMR
jgi:pimeloyl-ACP methyl ester carboxylesterase